MRWKWHSAEDIVGKLECVRNHMNAGMSQKEAVEAAGIAVATYHRWKLQYDNLEAGQVTQLRRLINENARLRRALAELDGAVQA